MKIGIDARLWSETGVGRYIRNLVKELQILDEKNEYVLFMRSKDRQQLTINNSPLTKNKKWKIVIADIRWHTLDEQTKLPQILNKENLDLVHFPYFSVPVAYTRPFVMTIHDLIINHFPTGKASKLPLYLYQLKRMGYKYIVSRAVNRAEKIIVPLNAVKDDLEKTLDVPGKKIIVTHEGYDEKIQNDKQPASVDNTKYFLYVGNAYPHKNLERLITAFSQMVSNKSQINSNGLEKDLSNSGIKLLLVGKDDYFYKNLQAKILKENYSGIIIRNNVTDRELAYFYQNAIALVSPSLMEGFGLPVLEAMTSSCLVLASDIPSFKEVAKNAAVYFDPYSIEDIKEKMKSAYLIDNNTKQEYIKQGEKRVKDFSWEKMAETTLDVYNSQMVSNDSRIDSNK